jgi:hypothetical protein
MRVDYLHMHSNGLKRVVECVRAGTGNVVECIEEVYCSLK